MVWAAEVVSVTDHWSLAGVIMAESVCGAEF